MMPATAREINKEMKENNNPYIASQGIRMQAYYMSKLDKQNWSDRLYITYQAYNGGYTNLKREYERAGSIEWKNMKEQCHRRVITLKNGNKLSLCDVNYDYSMKVYKYGQQYKIGETKRRYW
jgi:hypothetical protein